MTYQIKQVAVIGAGTMGGGIAALIASVGIPVTLLDVPPRELTPEEQARGLTLQSPEVRNRIVRSLWERQLNAKPPALFTPDAARLVTLGNTEDDFDKLRQADWIIEAIVEQLEPKRQLMERIEAVRKPRAIVSSNTSGIPIAQIAAGRSAEFRRHFLGTHFFNPPRYLKLLELIPTPDTDPELVRFMQHWARRRLGKGTVIAKDRPNFIGNRIGIYVGQVRMLYALEHGYSIEEVDALTGPLIGNPKTATFRLADLVGLDVMAHVTDNLYQAVPDDEERERFRLPEVMRRLIQAGALGNKTGAGFYKKVTTPDGATEYHVLNLQTGAYEPPKKVRFELVGQARQIEDLGARLRMIFERGQGDRAGDYIINTTLPILAYAARRVPEIADSLRDIDNAMRWGFNLEMGPFELWDALGVRKTVELMRQRGIAVPAWVEQMLAKGHESFYRYEDGRLTGVYDPMRGEYVPIERPPTVIVLRELHGTRAELRRNDSASLLDLGDGVLGLEFHAKANALDPQIFEMGYAALQLLEHDAWQALVIGNQGPDFSVGANLGLFIGAVQSGQLGMVEPAVKQMQDLLLALRYAAKPVVTAPFRRVLGGGTEVALHGARIVAAAETYMGLVEFGVGLIPAGGGCKEVLRRIVAPNVREGVDVLPFIQQAFELIGFAKVSESAAHARQLGFLGPLDRIVMNDDELIGEAKRVALELVEEGYTPPLRQDTPIYAVGRRAKAAMLTAIKQMEWGRFISPYDAHIARKLAHVLAGGDLSAPQWVSEQYILDLEREAFLSLLGEPKTQERIAHMLKTGKPLRN
ncbi:3-hydroxyacyl-CoA dehydrogenase/enoyl-CoA hydratase family protein [Kallotenue papyrolyticum]|uniref:3-hydroxyacyl-CoA dehydrogenase/enoyl-CoA hydratase family protein n=1 Tax=Kallotenue papyrolyticum TaxID=1325125 RepID=UPI0004929B64|nr:3-hydroxyacyl-CoA dehydrogenase/enoyl-CoA hydratase family protein [Kallotenue papyrolyticum]